jgi:hypothetical protein
MLADFDFFPALPVNIATFLLTFATQFAMLDLEGSISRDCLDSRFINVYRQRLSFELPPNESAGNKGQANSVGVSAGKG